jgi:hypothetical protein
MHFSSNIDSVLMQKKMFLYNYYIFTFQVFVLIIEQKYLYQVSQIVSERFLISLNNKILIY